MSIDDYITQFASIINTCPIVTSYHLQVDRKTKESAFVSGRIDFRDGSILDIKEVIEQAEKRIEKYKYAYNYRQGSETIFGMIMLSIPERKDYLHSHTINICAVENLLHPSR